MKNIIAILIVLVSITFLSTNAVAQSKSKVRTESIKVEGNCGMCKKRIEDAAYIKGVKRAEWSSETGLLTVTYNSKKTSIDKITNSIVNVGHDANGVKATDKIVEALPACCNYRHEDAEKH